MIYVNEGKQAEEYKKRKSDEKYNEEKKEQERYLRHTPGARGELSHYGTRFNKKSDDERNRKVQDIYDRESFNRSQQFDKYEKQRDLDGMLNGLSHYKNLTHNFNRALDGTNRHIRRHPKQYDKKYNESYGIFESVEMI